jgi:hypothetical protein
MRYIECHEKNATSDSMPIERKRLRAVFSRRHSEQPEQRTAPWTNAAATPALSDKENHVDEGPNAPALAASLSGTIPSANAIPENCIIGTNPWLVSRPYDLLFVCGLAPWLFGLIAYCTMGGLVQNPSANPQQHTLTVFLAAASLLVGESHQFTSIIRYYFGTKSYKRARSFDRLPFWVLYSSVLVLAPLTVLPNPTDILDHSPGLNALLTVPIVVFQLSIALFPMVLMQHFCAQTKAIGVMYCGMNGYRLSETDRMVFSLTAWLMVGAGICTIAGPLGINITAKTTLEALHDTGSVLGLFAVVILVTKVVHRGLNTGEWCHAMRFCFGPILLFTCSHRHRP